MRKALLGLMLSLALLGLAGCGAGGQEIESCLFVIAMAVDPAPDGNLTVTVKALSGSQADGTEGSSASGGQGTPASGGEGSADAGQSADAEQPEPGYIVLSATAPSCLRALGLLSATTPRTVNLSQLQEIVLSRTLAETEATLSILEEIHAMYRANGAAIVVVTPDDAGDFVRRQHALLGVRLSKYLSVLFEHFAQIDIIPPKAELASVIAAMRSRTEDAAAVYAAGNDFSATLVLPDTGDTDRLPGHLPRTSPAQNEYLGSAIFSGARMTGVLTGSETATLCLLLGKARTRTSVIDGALYKTNVHTKVKRRIEDDGTLRVEIALNLTLVAGESAYTDADIGAQIEREAVLLIRKLQSMESDALGFGELAIRGSLDIPSWEARNWPLLYAQSPVRVTVRARVL